METTWQNLFHELLNQRYDDLKNTVDVVTRYNVGDFDIMCSMCPEIDPNIVEQYVEARHLAADLIYHFVERTPEEDFEQYGFYDKQTDDFFFFQY